MHEHDHTHDASHLHDHTRRHGETGHGVAHPGDAAIRPSRRRVRRASSIERLGRSGVWPIAAAATTYFVIRRFADGRPASGVTR